MDADVRHQGIIPQITARDRHRSARFARGACGAAGVDETTRSDEGGYFHFGARGDTFEHAREVKDRADQVRLLLPFCLGISADL